MARTKKADTEVVGPLRIEKAVMDKIRKVAERDERTYIQQINFVLRKWVESQK
jgi:hypothetical protein